MSWREKDNEGLMRSQDWFSSKTFKIQYLTASGDTLVLPRTEATKQNNKRSGSFRQLPHFSRPGVGRFTGRHRDLVLFKEEQKQTLLPI